LDPLPRHDPADLEGTVAFPLQDRQRGGNVARRHDGDHADAQVEGPLHLSLLDGPFGRDQLEDRGPGPGPGIDPGPRALDMFEIGRPDLDWVCLAKGMGVPGKRVTSLDAFTKALREGFESQGPMLIEVPLLVCEIPTTTSRLVPDALWVHDSVEALLAFAVAVASNAAVPVEVDPSLATDPSSVPTALAWNAQEHTHTKASRVACMRLMISPTPRGWLRNIRTPDP